MRICNKHGDYHALHNHPVCPACEVDRLSLALAHKKKMEINRLLDEITDQRIDLRRHAKLLQEMREVLVLESTIKKKDASIDEVQLLAVKQMELVDKRGEIIGALRTENRRLSNLLLSSAHTKEEEPVNAIELPLALKKALVTNPTTVYLDDTQITDAGMVHLKGLTSLRWLYLTNTQITDAGLEHLKGLTSLEWLDFRNTRIGDAGLKHLKGLTRLEYLYLENTQITNAGLKHLKGLTRLRVYR